MVALKLYVIDIKSKMLGWMDNVVNYVYLNHLKSIYMYRCRDFIDI
jgi:hypothetical protein